jgi:hypothetical protein
MKKIILSVGDEVIIRSDLINGDVYGDDTFVYNMICCIGMTLTIIEKNGKKYIMNKCCDYNFTKEMIDIDKTYELQNKNKWLPEIGESYWYIGSLRIIDNRNDNDGFDRHLFKSNNYFRTRQLARIAKKAIETVLEDVNHG